MPTKQSASEPIKEEANEEEQGTQPPKPKRNYKKRLSKLEVTEIIKATQAIEDDNGKESEDTKPTDFNPQHD